MSYLNNGLPPELVFLISDFLPLSSLGVLTQTCRHLYTLLQPTLNALLTPELARDILFDAAGEGRVDVVKKLLSPPLSTNPNDYKDTDGTPLHTAARGGHTEIIQLLLGAKADIHRRWSAMADDEPMAMTPLHIAVLQKDVRTVQLLLNNGADVHAPYGESWGYPICDAAEAGDTHMVRMLHLYGANLEQDDGSATPLGHAILEANISMIHLLLKVGADANAHTQLRYTRLPLVISVAPERVGLPTAAGLLYYTLDLANASSTAFGEEKVDIIKLLLKYGARKEDAVRTVYNHLPALAEVEGITEKQLLAKVEGIFASAEAPE